MDVVIDGLSQLTLASSPAQQAIERRASEIQSLGQYWGFADWLAWGYSRATRVTILIGPRSIDIFEVFTPVPIYQLSLTWERHLHVIGVKYSFGGSCVASEMSRVNHFVYCLPNEAVFSEGVAPLHLATGSAFDSLSGAEAHLMNYYGHLGYVVFFTVANGCCADDCVVFHEGAASSPVEWKRVRLQVRNAHMKLRFESWYGDAFKACQEYEDDEDCVTVNASVKGNASVGVEVKPPSVPVIDADEEKPAFLGGTYSAVEEVGALSLDSDEEVKPPSVPLGGNGSAAFGGGLSLLPPSGPPPLPPPSFSLFPTGVPEATPHLAGSHAANLAALAEVAGRRKRTMEGQPMSKKHRMRQRKQNFSYALGERKRLGDMLLQFAEGRAPNFEHCSVYACSNDQTCLIIVLSRRGSL